MTVVSRVSYKETLISYLVSEKIQSTYFSFLIFHIFIFVEYFIMKNEKKKTNRCACPYLKKLITAVLKITVINNLVT